MAHEFLSVYLSDHLAGAQAALEILALLRKTGDSEVWQGIELQIAEDRAELVRGDALALAFDAEFDVVTCFGALGHIESKDEDRFVAGISRALRPGG